MRAYERLMRYARFDTPSTGSSDTCPSTPEQLVLAAALAEEMREMGLSDVRQDEHGYVYGRIPANIPNCTAPTIGFIAHMDVANDVPCTGVQPQVLHYDGSDLLLSEETGAVLSESEFPVLADYRGCDLVTTDGRTLLGADNKAGIAEILTACERLLAPDAPPHGDVCIGFTPDEEIGRGADLFDVAGFGAPYAYTVDGGAFGQVEYETFNAASASIAIKGKNIHPGDAKNKMKNALLIGMEFNSMLPPAEIPAHTEGHEGFYHLTKFTGAEETVQMRYILRDHDWDKLTRRKETVLRIADYLNAKYGAGTVTVTLQDSYRNLEEVIRKHWHLVEVAYEAVTACGGTPVSPPVRGGTDGSRLSFMGLPCPNLGTGSHNHHGRLEFAVVQEMDKCVDMLVKIAELYGKR